ncbi:hypothetical protein ACJJTC_012274 [Scirpophaga incertulas]
MSVEKIEKLFKKRGCIKSKLTIFGNYLNLLQSSSDHSEIQLLDLESRYKKFNNLYEEFDKLQDDIELLSDKPDTELACREQFEEQYFALVAAARRLLGDRHSGSVPQDASGSSSEIERATVKHSGHYL